MRKTTAPETPPDPTVSAPKREGLIAQAQMPGRSAATTRALDTRSHRTMLAADGRLRKRAARASCWSARCRSWRYLWKRRSAGEPFIEITDALPELRQVQHRNIARITVRTVERVRTPTLQIFSAIDNLVKGAAGQAVQNANLMLGLDETLGLPA